MEKYRVKVNDKVYEVEIEKIEGDFVDEVQSSENVVSTESSTGGSEFKSPIQGAVLSVAVKAGDPVTKGQTLLIVEAMKLENEIVSDQDGIISEVLISEGQTVNSGEVLVKFRG